MVHVNFPVLEPGPPDVNDKLLILAVQGGMGVAVAEVVGVGDGVADTQLLFVITFESRVTAASLERSCPSMIAPVLAVIVANESTCPTNVELVPKVAALATVQ